MKEIIIAAFLITVVSSPINFAQYYEMELDECIDYLKRDRIIFNSNQKAYENIDGTPYLNREFEEGKVYLETGEVLIGEFRFDLYADHVQFIHEGSRYVIAYPEKVARIELNGHVFKYIDYKIDAGVDQGYFIVLAEGACSLYLQKSKTLREAVSAKPYQQPHPPKFLDHRDYCYVKIGEDPAQRVRNKRRLIKMFGDIGPEVEKYIKEEKIRVRREYDLVKLINYINSELMD